jgi:RNA polymerase sigma-70 factor (ECF subfamily)
MVSKSGMKNDDQQLVEGLKKKDIKAFEYFFNEYHKKIFGLIYKLTRNETDAQDLTQEVFLKIFEKVDTFEGRSAFSSWVYRIAVNTSFMKLRTKRNQPELSLDSLLPQFYESGYQKQMTKDWSRKTEEALLNEESKKVIHKAIDKLPEKEKVVFILRDVEEISTERVGEILGLTVPAVKSRLHRARLFLRKKLSKYFEEFQPTGQ